MKCFNHSDSDAVGTCARCGKAVCRLCVMDLDDALLCLRCVEAEEEAVAVEARRLVRRSWYLTVSLGGLLAVAFLAAGGETSTAARLGLAAFAPYAVWGTYWGWKRVWPWWKGLFRNSGCFVIATPVGWLVILFFTFWIAFVLSYLYGVLGGGFVEYRRYRRTAAR